MDNNEEQYFPWWQNGTVVTILGSLVASIMPITTFLGGYMQKETELQLNAQKQSHEIQLDYLDRALRPGITEAEQELIFSLFAEMNDQPAIQQWAKSRGASLLQEINRLKAEIADKTSREQAARDELQLMLDKLATLAEEAKAGARSPDQLTALRQSIVQGKAQLAQASVASAELSREVARLKERTGDPEAAPAPSLVELVNRLNSSNKSERMTAVQQLIDDYNYNPNTIPQILSLFDEGSIASLSASGRYNALYVLSRMSGYAWTKPLIGEVERVLTLLEERNAAGISALGQQTSTMIKELREHLVRARESPASWG